MYAAASGEIVAGGFYTQEIKIYVNGKATVR